MATIDERLDNIEEFCRMQVDINQRTLDMVEILGQQLERMDARLEETRRDCQQTQRLWTRLALKHGWLEDDDLASP